MIEKRCQHCGSILERPNPEMLRLARWLRGATQADLSKATGIDQGIISKYEGGIRILEESHIELFSKALHFSPAFFFREGKMYPAQFAY